MYLQFEKLSYSVNGVSLLDDVNLWHRSSRIGVPIWADRGWKIDTWPHRLGGTASRYWLRQCAPSS